MLKRMVALFLEFAAVGAACQSIPCDRLATISVPDARVSIAQTVAAGSLRLPESANPEFRDGVLFRHLPAFCRVAMSLTPTRDSDIAVELWLPLQHWNGRFLGVGNGGFAGQIDYRSLASAVEIGYAAAATDTGHSGSFASAQWALGHPQKITDFGYRAIHQMTLDSKSMLESFYASPARYSYFESCSDGGREALMEAQRFPSDYDGILAGAPANNWTRLLTNAVLVSQALAKSPGSAISPAKLPAIHAAVLAACGAQDGLPDGIVNDPRRCRFNPSVLLCRGRDNDRCLTRLQVTALRAIYAGMREPNGRQIYPGYEPGGEMGTGDGWAAWLLGSTSRPSLASIFGTRYFSDMVYSNPNWSPAHFNARQALRDAQLETGKSLDATDPDLRPFSRHGGKLILYQGWSDAAIPPVSTIDYYNQVRKTMGATLTDAFLRLYMVPGMQHCGQGPGANEFGQNGPSSASGPEDARHDIRLALQAWVEQNVPPTTIIAAKYDGNGSSRRIAFTRPLCPYPLVARYKGAGDPDKAASFVCTPEDESPRAGPESFSPSIRQHALQ